MFGAFYFAVTVLGLAAATYTDLRERIVPNRLVYGLGAIGIAAKAAESYLSGSAVPAILALEGGIIAFALSYALYRLGIWAGGDVKLVTAVSILNPVNYNFLGELAGIAGGIFSTIALPVFSASLVVYSALAIFPLGMAMSFSVLAARKDILSEALQEARAKAEYVLLAGAIASGLNVILAHFGINALLSIPILLLLVMQKKKKLRIVAVVVSAGGAIVSLREFVYGAAWIAIPVAAAYTLWILYARCRPAAFKETVKTSQAAEGMVPDAYVVERKGTIFFEHAPGMISVIKQLIANRTEKPLMALNPEGKVISGPGNAGGLTESEAKHLREMASGNKAPKEMVVRKTMAFVPAMLLAYISLQLTGDIIWNILLK
ncbi:MAG: prepilin peptidase [Candidatus Diapherotrites archaeon]|uniref:Prepilin peptidase n=1 Tax=Candidatus Iainarchaeum sp. TaxID=3101447 RepID=A0A8T3YMJ6_9ARCH|nr:prepilin peptidase [Candidatus Diapherotrites archaeon]